MKRWLELTSALLLLASVSVLARQADRLTTRIDSEQTVTLRGTLHPLARPDKDKGPLDPSMQLPYVTLLFQPSAAQQAAMQKLLAEQQDRNSPNYRKSLTPEQYGERFGLSDADISRISHWLQSQGFTIKEVARGRNWIAFSGTVGQINRAFHTELHRYDVNGEERFANNSETSIPKALEGIVSGFRGLNNFKVKSMMVRKSALSPEYTDGGGNHFLAPDDIATIYDIGPLYTAGIDGTGMQIAIMGQTDIHVTDIQAFRTKFNLTANDPTEVLATGCTDPGFTGDEGEADLDIEWSGAVARKATIIYVKCDTNANSGVITSLQYAVNNDTAPVLSMSYGGCEADEGGAPGEQQYQAMIQQANIQGQTLMVSSGDSGSATCDSSGAAVATHGLAVNGLASPPEVTAVGGTEFNEGAGTYWNAGNGANGGSAKSYIPELGWNDSSLGTGLGGGLDSTGGGASTVFAKPPYQKGAGTFDAKFRSMPDVSMPASADHDGYLLCSQGSCTGGFSIVGGTSVACPVFAGIVALLNQELKFAPPAGLGNINPTLYRLAKNVPAAFHDVPAGNYSFSGAATNASSNIEPCQSGTTGCPAKAPFQYGFLTGAGYDEVTGLGSVDADVFVTHFATAVNHILGDFDGDDEADVGVFRPSAGTWYILPSNNANQVLTTQWGTTNDVPVLGDYDGDGKTDVGVFRPSTGTWYILPSSDPVGLITQSWGTNGDIPVPGDYDGDGKTDFAVFRPSNGAWYIIPSSNPGSIIVQIWGTNGDIPVPGDYDGDGKTDIAVFRPSNGTWYIIPSNGGADIIKAWGTNGDLPVPGDYDGDGTTDVAVFRPSVGTWFIIPSSTPNSPTAQAWGTNNDVPVPSDYDGDGKTDLAVWRPSTGVWYIIPSSNPGSPIVESWGSGTAGDKPAEKPIGQ